MALLLVGDVLGQQQRRTSRSSAGSAPPICAQLVLGQVAHLGVAEHAPSSLVAARARGRAVASIACDHGLEARDTRVASWP